MSLSQGCASPVCSLSSPYGLRYRIPPLTPLPLRKCSLQHSLLVPEAQGGSKGGAGSPSLEKAPRTREQRNGWLCTMDARRTGATSPCSVGAAIGQQPRQAVKGGGRDTGARRARICSPQAEPLPIDSAASGAVFEALNTDSQRGGCGGLPHNTKGVKCTLGIRREKF